MSILFPLGIVLLGYGGFETSKNGFDTQLGLALAIGALLVVASVTRMIKARG